MKVTIRRDGLGNATNVGKLYGVAATNIGSCRVVGDQITLNYVLNHYLKIINICLKIFIF